MNLNTWSIAQMNLFLHDIDDAFIAKGDTLSDPKHLLSESSKTLRTFDRVLANPPFSLKNWGQEIWQKGDPFSRDLYGCPPNLFYGKGIPACVLIINKAKPKARQGKVLFVNGTEE